MTQSRRGSAFVRMQLGAMLKEFRQRAGWTIDAVGESKVTSTATLGRYENGRSPVNTNIILGLARLYELGSVDTDRLVELADASEGTGWIEDFGASVSEQLTWYVELEAASSAISTYEPELIHGLLQTEDYAREVTALKQGVDNATIDSRVAFRMARQREVFDRDHPEIRCVIGESALRFAVGSPDVMPDQIAHLKELSKHTDIRVRPFTAGLHLSISGGFTVLDFSASAVQSLIYTETHIGVRWMESAKQLDDYKRIFDELRSQSISMEDFQI